MLRFILFFVVTFICGLRCGNCQTYSPIDLSVSYELFVDKWTEFEFDGVRQYFADEGDAKSLITYEKLRQARDGNNRFIHLWKLDDPQYLKEEPVSVSETVIATTEGSNSLLRFSRGMKLATVDMPITPESEIFSNTGRWSGTLESKDRHWSHYRQTPFLTTVLDYDVLSGIRKLDREDIRTEEHNFFGETRSLIVAELENSDDTEALLYFVELENSLSPVGLRVHKKRVPTPNNQPVASLSPQLLKTWPKEVTHQEWLKISGEEGIRKISRIGKYHDGGSGVTEEVMELSNILLDPEPSSFGVPAIVPDGTEVFLEDSPQIKAEFRDGSVVNVYRGEVIENLGSVKMAPRRNGLLIGGVAVVAILLAGGLFYQFRAGKDW